MMKVNFILIIAMILLQSCSENRYEAINLRLVKPISAVGLENGNENNAKELSYKNVLNQVLQAKCLNCHSEKGGNRGHLNLETYQSVLNNREQIRDEVVTKKMPKKSVAPLTDEQIKLIVDWIDAGANEFETVESQPTPPPASPGEPPVVTPEPALPPEVEPLVEPTADIPSTEPVDVANMNFGAVMKLVIEPKCLQCHNTNAKNGIELATYADLLFQKDDIKKDILSAKMPGKDTLTDYQKKLILDWIAADMPE